MSTPNPSDSEILRLTQTAFTALARGDHETVVTTVRRLVAERPDDPNTQQLLGLLALQAGDPVAAKEHLERANAAAPDHPHILNSLGVALRRIGDWAGARAALTRAGDLGQRDAWGNLGNLEYLANNPAASAAAYEKALALGADDAATHAGLARALELRHELARARAHAERALALDPGNEIAQITLGQILFREGDFVGAERAVAPLTKNGSSPTNRALAWGIIGDARDRRDEPRAAFEAFSAAKAQLRDQYAALKDAKELAAHPDNARRLLEFVEKTDVRTWRHPRESRTPAPVFLVGFPRSGTTLLDQVLSSHSRIASIEEREVLLAATLDILMDPAQLEACGDLPEEEIERRRQLYWDVALTMLGESLGDRLLLDKLPLNIMFLPMIERLFPDSKVIVAIRDPRDVVLSCYQQRFGMNAAMAQFLDLESTVYYYDAVMRLYVSCAERMTMQMLIVPYEGVVSDLNTTAHALTEWLELPFEDAMLRYSETARSRDIDTPSAKQVLEPIYARSVGRWRRYAEQLEPVLPFLGAWAKHFGYPEQ